jgi:hypothetical protein
MIAKSTVPMNALRELARNFEILEARGDILGDYVRGRIKTPAH